MVFLCHFMSHCTVVHYKFVGRSTYSLIVWWLFLELVFNQVSLILTCKVIRLEQIIRSQQTKINRTQKLVQISCQNKERSKAGNRIRATKPKDQRFRRWEMEKASQVSKGELGRWLEQTLARESYYLGLDFYFLILIWKWTKIRASSCIQLNLSELIWPGLNWYKRIELD